MSNIPSQEEFDKLKSEFESVKKELEANKVNATPMVVRQLDQGEQILSQILQKGVQVFDDWNKGQVEVRKYEIDKNLEIEQELGKTEREKYNTIKTVDKREKILHGVLILFSLLGLFVLAFVDKVTPAVATIIGFIIASVFKNSITDFLKDIHKGFSESKDESN